MAEYFEKEKLCDWCLQTGPSYCDICVMNRHDLPAADAIEELQATVEGYESSTNMAFLEKDGETVIEFVPKWINVKERLPEQGERYLVIRYDYVTKTPFIDILWYDAHDLWWNRLYKGQYNVTHWMRLPEPPKEE